MFFQKKVILIKLRRRADLLEVVTRRGKQCWGQNYTFLKDEFKFSNYLFQILKLHMVLLKLEMVQKKFPTQKNHTSKSYSIKLN
jgi:hypothetical protein